MHKESLSPLVYTPGSKPHLKKGRGFSKKEIQEAGLSLMEAKKLGIYIDPRRRSGWSSNVEALKKIVELMKKPEESKENVKKS